MAGPSNDLYFVPLHRYGSIRQVPLYQSESYHPFQLIVLVNKRSCIVGLYCVLAQITERVRARASIIFAKRLAPGIFIFQA
eukprot:scaffold519368_cov19-Prasinocladus_malaysianus.AAC.1